MFEYTITSAKKLGDYDKQFGQRWWCDVSEDLKPIMFNTMEHFDVFTGTKITAEESLNKRSSKGTNYLQLRKVKLAGQGVQNVPPAVQELFPGAQPVAAQAINVDELLKVLAEINDKLDKLLGDPLGMLPDIEQQHADAQAKLDGETRRRNA